MREAVLAAVAVPVAAPVLEAVPVPEADAPELTVAVTAAAALSLAAKPKSQILMQGGSLPSSRVLSSLKIGVFLFVFFGFLKNCRQGQGRERQKGIFNFFFIVFSPSIYLTLRSRCATPRSWSHATVSMNCCIFCFEVFKFLSFFKFFLSVGPSLARPRVKTNKKKTSTPYLPKQIPSKLLPDHKAPR